MPNEDYIAGIRAALKSGAVIHLSPQNLAVREGRRPIDPDTLERLKESIAKLGVLNPITAFMVEREEPAGQPYDEPRTVADFVLVAGLHRLQAAIDLGLETVPVRLAPSDDAVLVELVENIDRKEICAVERAEMTAHAAEMLKERRRRDGKRTGLGGVGRPAPPKAKQPNDGSRTVARLLKTSRDNVRRAERFRSLDQEAKDFLMASAKLRNSSEAIDATARIPTGEQVAFLRELERADRLQDVTRKIDGRQVQRIETDKGELEKLAYDAVKHIEIDGPEPPMSTAPPEILPPPRRPGKESLWSKLNALTESSSDIFKATVLRLDSQFLVHEAHGLIDEEISRRRENSPTAN